MEQGAQAGALEPGHGIAAGFDQGKKIVYRCRCAAGSIKGIFQSFPHFAKGGHILFGKAAKRIENRLGKTIKMPGFTFRHHALHSIYGLACQIAGQGGPVPGANASAKGGSAGMRPKEPAFIMPRAFSGYGQRLHGGTELL
ncbi:hypothetical protein SDC9_162523 [bioreactor metagenome]|uniref:Uncharacterized protein n=1 Tax=bioreactor metagenome TaxID=1076179 RepID=A0A645FSN7_9ZZZZ